ncbi:MAG: hypothetical protein IJV73_01665 [Clostridia bacterium]|nr:hypothetical protein [Clostridia bacterium]
MRSGKKWTREEEEQLAEEWGMYSADAIAKRLGRTRNAVVVRVARLGLGAHLENSAMISFNVLIKELGFLGGYEWQLQKLTEAGLKIHMQRVKDCAFRMVDIDEFWEFAENNKHLIDFSRLEENALGAEPDWVKAKRTEDFKRKCVVKPHNAKWTEAEDKELLRLLRTYRYTYPEIADRLRRSEGAIQRRVNDLGIKERPLKADNHTLWTEDQIQTLCQMIKDGSNYESMSRVLGKSSKAIRGKVFTVYLTENLAKVSKMLGDGEWGDNRPERRIGQKLLMSVEEKAEVKEEMSKLVSLLTYQIRKHFDDQDNWQRNLCQHWDKVRGCTAGETNCDACSSFQRIRPQYCGRCGATFYERQPNRICERCRIQRKKQGYRKYLRMKGGNK